MSAEFSKCRGCGAPVIWRYTQGGRLMPLDAEPGEAYAPGTFVLLGPTECRPADQMFDTGAVFYMNHWATCPVADSFRGVQRG